MDNNIPAQPAQVNQPIPNPVIPAKPKSSKMMLIIVLLILTALLLAVIVYFVKSANTKVVDTQTFITSFPSPSISAPVVTDTSSWKTYTDPEAGFSFKYPQYVSLNGETEGDPGLDLTVSVDKLSDIPEDMPMFMGRNDAIKEKELLATGEGVGSVKIGSLNGQIKTTHSRFEVCSVLFEKTLTFFPGDYRVILTLIAPESVVTSEMPEFFTVDKVNCDSNPMWDMNKEKIPQFDQTLENNQGKGIAQQWYNTFNEIVNTVILTTPAPTIVITAVPTTPVITAVPTIQSGLPTYKNTVYGFEISYPLSYKAMDSKDDLYGYPNGIVLLYGGGQSYDVVVEIWNTKAEYEKEYSFRMADLTVIPYGNKFITLLNNNQNAETAEIISSFKQL